MKKIIVLGIFSFVFFGFNSMEIHKFYMSIFQINFVPEKKMVQITSRIFIDDLNNALQKKYSKRTHIEESGETLEDETLLKKYFFENFTIKIDGQQKKINYLSKELEGNVVICYFNITSIPKIKTIEIQNTCLFDLNSDQQNIIQTTLYNKKESILMTVDSAKALLKI